ncbi:MAG: nucleotide exchange factor GrpE, partial [bacterium]|nr:nucleotide exchange factor GrpE [bacterium]
MSEDIKTGIYRHYKNKEYRVLYTAIDTETKEEMVVYQAMYGEGKIWVRPKKIFLEEVEADGQKKSRFEFISEDDNDWQNLYKRALADYQNLLKQTAKEKMEFAVYANENMLREILPVYDNLKMAMEH